MMAKATLYTLLVVGLFLNNITPVSSTTTTTSTGDQVSSTSMMGTTTDILDKSNKSNETTPPTRSQANLGSSTDTSSSQNSTDNATTGMTSTDPSPKADPTSSDSTAETTSLPTTKATAPTPVPTSKPAPSVSVRNGLIIFIVILIAIFILFLCCWCKQKKRTNSFNLYQQSSNTNIPLSSKRDENNATQNPKEDKIDIHPIEPPSENSAAEDSPKEAPGGDPAAAPEGESHSTASTAPKDDELDKVSVDSSQASLLSPSTGNLKIQEQEAKPEDVSAAASAGTTSETPEERLNENNNNSKSSIEQLKKRAIEKQPGGPDCPAPRATARNHAACLAQSDEREPIMRAASENQGRWSGQDCQATMIHQSSDSTALLIPEL